MKAKEKFEKLLNKKYTPYILIILLGIVVSIPLFTMNLSEYNEFRIHIARVTTVKEILKDGVFPPLISYKHMLTFVYALNIFYGPFTTYIPIIISIFTGSTVMAIKVFTLLTVIFSGITMYWFTYKVTSKKTAALISAFIYMVAPYKFTDIYSRNAMGEYAAFIFIPMIFQGVYELINNEKKGNYMLVIGATLLILSHTITTIYVVLFACLFLIFNYKKILNWNFWKNIIIDCFIILIFTSFYTIPLIEHKINGEYTIFDSDAMLATGWDAYENTNNISDWFKSELSHDELIFSFGLAMTFLIFLTIFCLKKVDEKYKEIYTTYGVLALISLFMCTKLFPWIAMPHFLTIIQFAWRINGFFIFFISFVCGINLYVFSNILYSIKYTILCLISAVIFILGWLGVAKYVTKSDVNVDTRFEKNLVNSKSIGPFNVNREYLPFASDLNLGYMEKRENRTYVLKGNATIVNESKEKLKDSIQLKDVNSATLELPYLYYHGYTVTLNDEKLKPYQSDKGFICVDVNEDGDLKIGYTGTAIEKAGYVISIGGVIITLAYIGIKKH